MHLSHHTYINMPYKMTAYIQQETQAWIDAMRFFSKGAPLLPDKSYTGGTEMCNGVI